jgi:hypothetical protein
VWGQDADRETDLALLTNIHQIRIRIVTCLLVKNNDAKRKNTDYLIQHLSSGVLQIWMFGGLHSLQSNPDLHPSAKWEAKCQLEQTPIPIRNLPFSPKSLFQAAVSLYR